MNGIIVAVMTMPVLKWTKRFNLNVSCAVSAIVWGVGLCLFGWAQTPWQYYGANLILTFGENRVFANGYLLIESLAPENMRGAYLGSSNLSMAGVVLGPAVGGYILGTMGGQFLFTAMSLLLLGSAACYLLARPIAK